MTEFWWILGDRWHFYNRSISAVLPKWELIVYKVAQKYINLASSSEGFAAASHSSRHAHHWPTCLLFDDRFIGMSWQGTSGVCHISSVSDSDLVSLNGSNLCSPWSSCEFWLCSIPAPPCVTGPWHCLPLQVPTVRPNAGYCEREAREIGMLNWIYSV